MASAFRSSIDGRRLWDGLNWNRRNTPSHIHPTLHSSRPFRPLSGGQPNLTASEILRMGGITLTLQFAMAKTAYHR